MEEVLEKGGFTKEWEYRGEQLGRRQAIAQYQVQIDDLYRQFVKASATLHDYLETMMRANSEAFLEVAKTKFSLMDYVLSINGFSQEWEARGEQRGREQASAQYQALIAELKRSIDEHNSKK
jgi:hypothetical protein